MSNSPKGVTPFPSVIRKYRLDNLNEVLHCDFGIEAFRKFCVSEFAAENLLFWEAVEQYRITVLRENNPDRALFQASLLYKKYIVRDAPLEVNLSSETLRETLQALVAVGVITQEESESTHLSAQKMGSSSMRPPEIAKPPSTGWVSNSASNVPRRKQQATLPDNTSTRSSSPANVGQHLPIHTVYDSAQTAIFNLMESDTFSRFCFSVQHKEMMRELMKRKEQAEVLRQIEVL